ncbi:hypothetical protein SAMN04487773_0880 [Enterobacter sp. kpr-6]|nr:hypothetical protein SAMN04487773_0880 [Enterobacter sp. kpr-6]
MFEPGTHCIHTSKWEKRKCRVVAYDGDSVVVKMERGGYAGVPKKSLTPLPEAPKQEVK